MCAMCSCVYVGTCTCACTYGGQRTQEVLLINSQPYSFVIISLTEPGTRLAVNKLQQAHPISTILKTGVTVTCAASPSFLCGCWYPDSGSYAHIACVLTCRIISLASCILFKSTGNNTFAQSHRLFLKHAWFDVFVKSNLNAFASGILGIKEFMSF